MAKKKNPQVKESNGHGRTWKMGTPDEVLAQTVLGWNTADGKAPIEVRCKVPRCPEFTWEKMGPLCQEHKYAYTATIRSQVADRFAKGTVDGR